MKPMAKEFAAFQQRARKPEGVDKGERGTRCLGATKQYCDFEFFFLFRLLAIFRMTHLHPHSPPNTGGEHLVVDEETLYRQPAVAAARGEHLRSPGPGEEALGGRESVQLRLDVCGRGDACRCSTLPRLGVLPQLGRRGAISAPLRAVAAFPVRCHRGGEIAPRAAVAGAVVGRARETASPSPLRHGGHLRAAGR